MVATKPPLGCLATGGRSPARTRIAALGERAVFGALRGAACWSRACAVSLAYVLLVLSTAQAVAPSDDDEERPRPLHIALPDALPLPETDAAQSSSMSLWVRWLVLKNLPPAYEDTRRWNQTKEVYDGFRFRYEDGRLETKRRYKTVKHGTWSKYYVEFVDPENALKIDVVPSPAAAADRLSFACTIEAPLHLFGRISQWQRDVQWISLSANADARVRLSLMAEVGVRMNPLVFPPEVQFLPQVTDARLELLEFELHRVSQLHGPLAEELGHGLRRVLDDRLDEYSDRLATKMNERLQRQSHRLKLAWHQSLDDALKSWSVQAEHPK